MTDKIENQNEQLDEWYEKHQYGLDWFTKNGLDPAKLEKLSPSLTKGEELDPSHDLITPVLDLILAPKTDHNC